MAEIETNEMSKAANGGTEQMSAKLLKYVDHDLLDKFQIIPSRVREINPDKFRILWLHNLAGDPEYAHLKDSRSRDRFSKIVFCGHHQRDMYEAILGVPRDDKSRVIETAIEQIPYIEKSKDSIRIIYTSTPQRGLQILVPVFKALADRHPDWNLHLDVFSSFKIYGWDDTDKQFEPLYDECRNHPNITYHGFSPKETVIEHIQKAHIFGFPSIWPECNSQALIEAMSGGLMCIHSDLGGNADTSGGLTLQYPFVQDMNQHAQVFYSLLEQACSNIHSDDTQNYLRFVKQYADVRFSIQKFASLWTDMLQDVVRENGPREFIL